MSHQLRMQITTIVAALALHVAGCDSGTDGAKDTGAGGSGGATAGAGGTSSGGSGGAGGFGGSGGSGGRGGSGGAGGTGTGGSGGAGGAGARDGGAGNGGRGGSGGSGGSATDGGAGDRSGGTAGRDGSTGVGDGGSSRPSNPEIDQRCTVPVTFRNQAATSQGGMVFNREIPDAVATMQAHARAVCNILYRNVSEVKNVNQQGLTIDMHDGVAFAGGGNITFSATYIGSYSQGKQPPAINFELNGVLVHESTHVWQYTNGGGWLVEAMADYVRYRAGFDKLSRRRPGGNWNSPYTTGGFFIVWIEDKYDPDFGYKVNMGMKNSNFNYASFVQQVTGKSVDAAWAEYQADIR